MSGHLNRYPARSNDDLVRLVREHPLAWIVSGTAETFRASLLPVMAETDEQGAVSRLVGHFARSNDQYKLLLQEPRAVMLVLGTNGYISVSWMQDKSQAPTWNYASAQFFVDVEFFAEAEPLQKHLREFSETMEAVTARAPGSIPWDVDQMGPRYASLSRGVIGFSARVREVRARFKLGQDERDDVYRDIIGGLDHSSATDLQALMKDFNPGRG